MYTNAFLLAFFDYNLVNYLIHIIQNMMTQQMQAKVTLKCLENILNRQEQGLQKDKIRAIMKKYEKSRNRLEVRELSPTQYQMYKLLMDGFNSLRESFNEIIKTQKFKAVNDAQIDIANYLMNIQTQIKLTKDTLTIDNILAKYAVLNLKLRKQYDVLSKEFLTQWHNKSKERMRKQEEKKQAEQIPKKIPNKNKNDSEDQSQEHPPPPPPVAKPRERVPEKRPMTDKPQRQVSREVKREVIQPKREDDNKRDMQSRRQNQFRRQREIDNNRRQREIQIKRESQADHGRSNRGRLSELQKYLESKHDLKFDKTKLKQISQFIFSKFQLFMRTTLQKVIDIAYLKNKANPKSGNQSTYFAPQYNRVCPQSPFYVTPNSKVFLLLYKHKLELYTQLRSKQFKKQDELRNALQAKTPEAEKKVDKRIQNYILKPRPNQVQPIEIFTEELEDRIPKNPLKMSQKKLSVGIDHFLYYLQNHSYLRNSLLLFDAYHY